ncbi:hypothetical protein BAE46_08300 [Glaciecola punicea]|nr:hypothetical protein BAE46_08300 [Glaciecola punicea]
MADIELRPQGGVDLRQRSATHGDRSQEQSGYDVGIQITLIHRYPLLTLLVQKELPIYSQSLAKSFAQYRKDNTYTFINPELATSLRPVSSLRLWKLKLCALRSCFLQYCA